MSKWTQIVGRPEQWVATDVAGKIIATLHNDDDGVWHMTAESPNGRLKSSTLIYCGTAERAKQEAEATLRDLGWKPKES